MKVIIYGIGKEYLTIFMNVYLVNRIIEGNGFEVIGFSDGNKDIWGSELIYNVQSFIVHEISEFQRENVEYILITTRKYFDEIRMELIGKGYKKEQILSVEKYYKSYVEQLLCVKELEGKLFDKIYSGCLNCDNVNFSLHTVWGRSETNNFLYKGNCLGKILIMDATDMSGIEDEKYEFVLSSNNILNILSCG